MTSTKPLDPGNYNHDLCVCLEELRSHRAVVTQRIERGQYEKQKLENQFKTLENKLEGINKFLSRENQKKADYDRTIHETEAAYAKILESSQTLLHVLKNETANFEQNDCEGIHDEDFHENFTLK